MSLPPAQPNQAALDALGAGFTAADFNYALVNISNIGYS
ncbi:Uncharacterised protein [Mycobacteroides abscessus subsp. massiliense]|nr:Uncharacterised protein [Mycobacteroides abscessus subsp. massiliense]